MKSKLFRVDFSDWGETNHHDFYHDNKTEEEFKKDFDSLLVKYGEEYISNKRSLNMVDWVEYAANRMGELGYIEVKYTLYCFNGLAPIGQLTTPTESEIAFEKIVGKDLMDKARNKSRDLREKRLAQIKGKHNEV